MFTGFLYLELVDLSLSLRARMCMCGKREERPAWWSYKVEGWVASSKQQAAASSHTAGYHEKPYLFSLVCDLVIIILCFIIKKFWFLLVDSQLYLLLFFLF